jgi:hypothetical protein
VNQKEKRKEQRRQRLEYLKTQHRCAWCARRDERTLSGKCVCSICAGKISELRQYRTQYRRENKLCVWCGKRDFRTESGKSLCEVCRMRRIEYDRRKREKEKLFKGVMM